MLWDNIIYYRPNYKNKFKKKNDTWSEISKIKSAFLKTILFLLSVGKVSRGDRSPTPTQPHTSVDVVFFIPREREIEKKRVELTVKKMFQNDLAEWYLF